MPRRTAPDRITSLEPNEIFVFGSNDQGFHAGGAAHTAVEQFGAIWGQTRGLQGQSYAIITVGEGVSVESIRAEVQDFFAFARANPELTFLMTRIGSGIAGFPEEQMRALFGSDTPDNVLLPASWETRP
jgi:hypothetical protein